MKRPVWKWLPTIASFNQPSAPKRCYCNMIPLVHSIEREMPSVMSRLLSVVVIAPILEVLTLCLGLLCCLKLLALAESGVTSLIVLWTLSVISRWRSVHGPSLAYLRMYCTDFPCLDADARPDGKTHVAILRMRLATTAQQSYFPSCQTICLDHRGRFLVPVGLGLCYAK